MIPRRCSSRWSPLSCQVTLIPADQTAAELVPIAINNRPEIASQRELLAAANQRLKQEKKRPFLPNLIILSPAARPPACWPPATCPPGRTPAWAPMRPAANFDVAAVWQLQNAGIGNIGRIRQRRAEQDLASIEVTRIAVPGPGRGAAGPGPAPDRPGSRPQTEEGLRQAIESADKNFIGLRETTRPAGELLRLVVRPQEVVAALIALNTAFEQYSAAVNEYNAAQFELYRALGQPAQWVTSQASHFPLIAAIQDPHNAGGRGRTGRRPRAGAARP